MTNKKRFIVIFLILFILSIVTPIIIFKTPTYYFGIAGSGLSPEYNSGDRVFVRKIDFKDLKIGDLIAFSDLSFHTIFGRISSIDYDNKIFAVTLGNYTISSLSNGKDLSSDLIFGKIVGKAPFLFNFLWGNLLVRLLIIFFLTYLISLAFKKRTQETGSNIV